MLILQRAKAAIFHGDGLLKVDIELTRPIRVGAGQHIWLRIPSASHTSFAESHPFAIASWGNTQNGKAKEVTLLIDVRAGFTRKLKMLANSESTNTQRFNAYIDGPYGLPPRAEEYGTVILYATGIGIGAQLATVKHLLERREAGTAKTQRVTLLWEVDDVFVGYDAENEKHFVKNDTAQQMVKDLLQQDCDRLSRLRLDPAATFKYKSGWQGAPPEQGYVRSGLNYPKSVADHLKMFRCTRYVRNKPQNVELDLDENDEDNHSSTDTLRTQYRGLNPEASLESQLQHDNCRGRVLVSGEYLVYQITLLLTSCSLCESSVRRFNT
jgi:NAD(P)H-flavin reductase